jgi:hypothetical protein
MGMNNMGERIQEPLYTKADLDKAFSMGLEKAVPILEEFIQLSRADQWRLIASLKRKIMKDKISVAMNT